MFLDELEDLDRKTKIDDREERKLIPIDSHSQLDTGFTGRSDCDERAQNERRKPKRGFLA